MDLISFSIETWINESNRFYCIGHGGTPVSRFSQIALHCGTIYIVAGLQHSLDTPSLHLSGPSMHLSVLRYYKSIYSTDARFASKTQSLNYTISSSKKELYTPCLSSGAPEVNTSKLRSLRWQNYPHTVLIKKSRTEICKILLICSVNIAHNLWDFV